MGQTNISFRPVRGTESQIMNSEYHEGWVYFATDSKKIYLDANGEAKLPMGGNSGIYYGIMKMEEAPPENQTEFEFTVFDIEGNEEDSTRLTIPNIDDLILNQDGCFYRVVDLVGEGLDTIIVTNKLTLAGGGGGPSGPSEDIGSYSLTNTTPKEITILSGQPYSIGFKAIATDYNGDPTGNGSYTLSIGGVVKETGVAKQGENFIPVEKYLSLGENKIRLVVKMDIGGADMSSKSLSYTVTATEMAVTWKYDSTSVNYTNENFNLVYEVSGVGITKNVNLIIDDLYSIPIKEGLVSTSEQPPFIFTPNDLVKYNLTHGAHKFKLQANAMLNDNMVYSDPVIYNVIFAEPGNSVPIISQGLFDRNLTQYNTVVIPIIIYSAGNTGAGETVVLREEGIEVDRWTDVANSTIKEWNYTPVVSGTRLLTIQCGAAEESFTVEVEELGIGIEEVANYVYRFKASDFASNTAIENWNSNGVTATFSPQFDWINGGLKSEKDENGLNRQYLCIKAGSTMTINHKLFEQNAKGGKNLKIIFQAANCRDYDAQVLESKIDTKVVKIDAEMEVFLHSIQDGDTIVSGSNIKVENNKNILNNPSTDILDLSDHNCRDFLKGRFIEQFKPIELESHKFIANKYFVLVNDEYVIATTFDSNAQYYEQKFYQIQFEKVKTEEEVAEVEYYMFFYNATVADHFEGFKMNAQYATINGSSSTLTTQYCEDTYIELEFDVSAQDSKNNVNPKNYIKYWIDGVPCGYTIYSNDDSFMGAANQNIVIGSSDCDVYLYMIKLYNKSLSDTDHLNNFIMDAPNAVEMLNRFKRNDIMDDNRKTEISPTKLAKANPDCLVHVYTTTQEGLPITKQTKRKGCEYKQYHNSDTAVISASDVTIKVQGTSSEKYVVAAANLDSEFTTGFRDSDGNSFDGWSMDGGKAIPVNFFCTKVNVASCENANNALNQEWYNMFQPYQTVVRCKKAGARDTMQFTNGVMFIEDHNPTYKTGAADDKKLNNAFGEINDYLNNPYPKLYSIANMGNSKDNISVFHDETNPLECCIEVNDNQTPQQWMVNDNYNKSDIGAEEDYFDFRYPDGIEEVQKLGEQGQAMIDGWNRFVSWMATSNPQPKYEAHTANSEEEYLTFAFNIKTQTSIPTYYLRDGQEYVLTEYTSDIKTYYTETEHLYGYTNLPLPANAEKHFDAYKFKGYKCESQRNEKGELWQKNYKPLIEGISVSTYAGDYTHDTYEYRMAKMLKECENYLVMDSVVFHYLFIERHTMIDNVAKNTFWSTEDGLHWNLTKDYDNDTADGNDNNGKFTRTYGMEAMDKLNDQVHVFNAHQAVWFNFIHGLPTVRQDMYNRIDELRVTYNGKILRCWSADDYLWFFKQWQQKIPERCWIEDYYRKYFRPYELYNDTMFNSMMEGGQKKHQRKQYETYQNTYMSSEYAGSDTQSSYLVIRSNGQGMLNAPLAVEVYSDCYIRMDTGSDTSSQRVKRNERNFFRCPTSNLTNATMYFYPAKAFSVIGSVTPGEGMVGDFYPEQLSFAGAGKLRELVVSTADEYGSSNSSLKTGFDLLNNPMLEILHAAKLSSYTGGLNLSGCANLQEVDARGSTFTAVEFADNAPLKTIKLHNPTSLSLSNSRFLEDLSITDFSRLQILKLHNVDNDYVSSLDLVERSADLRNYKLTDVDWTLNKSNQINTTDKTIPVLEKLLGINTLEIIKEGGGGSSYEPKQTSLTGEVLVSSSIYNGADSFEIYNKYAQDECYPNLDIKFDGATARLYSVEIYDGDNAVYWNRKLKYGESITEDFLSDGPKGQFRIEGIYKSSTPAHTFNFFGEWKVYRKNNLNTPIGTIKREDHMPYYENVTDDIVLIPQFTQSDRTYTLSFYGVDQTTPFEVKTYKYSTKWSEVQPGAIPYKEAPQGLYEAWDFKGYSLVANSTTIVPAAYEVTNDQSFYAVFELVSDIRTVVHEEWFDFTMEDYDYDTYYPDYAPPFPSNFVKKGYAVRPKVALKGKITIPSAFNGVPVIKIGRYFATDPSSNLTHDITHVFCAPNSQLLEVGDSAFNKTNLQYFDFSQNTVRAVGSRAFTSAKLNANNLRLSTSLFYVGEYAFNAGIVCTSNNAPAKTTITIPSSVALVHQYGFANPQVGPGSSWSIGTEQVRSKLVLNWPGLSNDYMNKFTADDGVMPNVTFLSEYYTDPDQFLDPGTDTFQVYRAFVRWSQDVKTFSISMNAGGGYTE